MLGDPRSLVVPDGTEAIEKFQHAEKDCERVFVPRSVAEIRSGAFYGCENLTEVVFEEGSRLVTIGDSAFQNCRNLARVNFPDRLRSIGQCAFRACEGLASVRLPDSLELIGVFCFAGSGLEQLVLPAGVREVGASAFQGCGRLRSVQLNEGLERLGAKEVIEGKECEGWAFAMSALESVKLPSTLKRVERGTFYGCRNLKSVEIPDGVEHIGEESFSQCALESVVLPASVEEICEEAFYGNRLREVVFGSGSRLRAVGDNAFCGNEQLDRESVCFPEGARVSEKVFGRVLGEEYEDVYEEELEEESELDGIEE